MFVLPALDPARLSAFDRLRAFGHSMRHGIKDMRPAGYAGRISFICVQACCVCTGVLCVHRRAMDVFCDVYNLLNSGFLPLNTV